jgi:parallel beta-helix repeat protein
MNYLLILLVFASGTAWAGQDVGNGGDIIVCEKSESNELEGYYSLDYVLTYQSLNLEEVNSLDASLERIGELLKSKVPELYLSFREFKADVYNPSYAKKHAWEAAPFGLIEIKDESIAVRLPDNCLKNDKINLIQAVIRLNPNYSGSETQIFKYMPSAIEKLNQERPVQTSFLMIHEWLWELSKNVDRNRRINRYLHSTSLTTQTSEEVFRELKGMGLTLANARYAFDSIQTAIDSAPSGSTIWVVEPKYNELLNIEKPVRLISLDPKVRPTIVGGLTIKSDGVSIEGFDFEVHPIYSQFIDIRDSKNIEIKGNKFRNKDHSIGSVAGDSQVTFLSNEFSDGSWGIQVYGGSTATFKLNKFDKVKWPIEAHDESQITVSENEFRDGITAIDIGNSKAGLAPNVISKNLIHTFEISGISLDDYSIVDIDQNIIQKSGKGIYLSYSPVAKINGNIFIENEYGVADLTGDTGSVTVKNNTFRKNKVGIWDYSKTIIGPNIFQENGRDIEKSNGNSNL